MNTRYYLSVLVWAGIAAGMICTEVARAECHAKDFNFYQMMAVAAELNDSVANLKALQAAGTGNGLLPVAVQITDRSSVELSMFAGYIVIYQRLTNDADRKATDNFITESSGGSGSRQKDMQITSH